jgi:enoyl-CoA hydratase/carnithine racemase
VRPRTGQGAAVGLALRDGVAWMTLARPRTGNRLDAELTAALAAACEAVADDASVRVVALTAEGRDFCAGLPADVAWPPAAWPDAIGAVARLTVPVVAGLVGAVGGWGVALALACDVRLATPSTVLRLDGASGGRLVGGGALPRLARMVGPSRAAATVLLETPIGARTAHAWGLVADVVPASRLRAAVAARAASLAARAPLALALAKETVVRALDLPLADGLRLEHDCYALLQTTDDRREGVAAFRARRAPRFQGQ